MERRVYNFSPGPAVMPLKVLEQAQRDLLALPGVGISPLEISHRSPWFDGVLEQTEGNLRKLLNLPANYRVLFMQGGSRLQFAMVPMNLSPGKSADYIVTGTWGKTALDEAQKQGKVRAAFNSKGDNFNRLPGKSELALDPNAAYVHFTSNETIQGVQFLNEPEVGNVPLVCDASSDFLCRPLPMEKYGLLYACAQKNAGPAGVTIVLVRDDLLERSSDSMPTMMNYKQYAAEKSLLNTPPVFRHLPGDARHALTAAGRYRRAGQNAGSQPAEGQIAVRRHRRKQRFLSGACQARLSLADERHIPPARR